MLDALSRSGAEAVWQFYAQLDGARRLQGRMFDFLGWGPQATAPTSTVLEARGLRLDAYGDRAAGPPIVLVPAPIKRAYIWDLAPGASVVGACLRAGLRPYLLSWDAPDPNSGIGDYAGRMLGEALAAACSDSGCRHAFVAGHSLGGLLCAAHAARHPNSLAGLILVATPLHFSHDAAAGALGPIIADIDRLGLLADAPGNLPGSFLSTASLLASPATFGEQRMADWVHCAPYPAARTLYLRVERWALDELPLARRLVEDLVALYRDDGFLRGRLLVDGRHVGAERIQAPLLTIADRRCAIVPPEAIRPAHDAASSGDKQWLWYAGDTGVAIQHVGVLIGRNALARLWPRVLDWVNARAEAVAV